MSNTAYSLHNPSSNHKSTILIVALLFITALVSAWWVIIIRPTQVVVQSKQASTTSSTVASPKYLDVSGKYLFSGTIMLGRAVETFAAGDYNQPFSGMDTLGQYDAGIGVLECPITSNNVSYQTQVNSLIFNCKPQWLPTLKRYYPIINLSSNHLYDQGVTGYNQTVANLTQAGFQVVGNYNPHIEPDDCKPVVIPVHLRKSNGQSVDGSLPIAFCSFNYKSLYKPAPGELESIQKWSKLMPVVALMNGGPEYQHLAGADQVSVAHTMIDYGADFVVGNGTHWVQNTEVYKGKLIVYSMGNFIFDQLDYDGRLALNLSVGMTLSYDANVSQWLKIGDNCKADITKCVELASAPGLKKINPSFKFDAIGSYGGYLKVATRANPQQQSDIEQRANWPTTQTELATPTP